YTDDFVQNGSFWRLRELSATITAPERFAQRVGASALNLTVAGRNLHTWTKYKGLDPEARSQIGVQLDAFDQAITPTLAQFVTTGLTGDELIDAQLSQVGWDYDRRTIFSASTPYSISACGVTQVPGLYTPLAVARYDADKILRLLQGWSDAQVTNRQSLIAT